MDEKLKSENMQKNSSFLCLCYILRAVRAGRCRERRYADHIFIQIFSRMHHFRSQILKIFFASGGKGALTPNQNPADVPERRQYLLALRDQGPVGLTKVTKDFVTVTEVYVATPQQQ